MKPASPGLAALVLASALAGCGLVRAGTGSYFVNLHDSATAAATFTLAPPAGQSFSAAAPVPGSTWNNLPWVAESVDPPGRVGNPSAGSNTGTYQFYAAPRTLVDSEGNASLVTVAVRVNYQNNGSRGISRIAQTSASYGADPLELMGRAWRVIGSQNSVTFTLGGLPPLTDYCFYFLGSSRDTPGRGTTITLAAANAVAGSASSVATTGTPPPVSIFNGGLLAAPGLTWNRIAGRSDAHGEFAFTQSADPNGQNFLNGFQLCRTAQPTWPDADGFGAAATGGAGGQTVTVTNSAQLLAFAASPLPYVINISGTIDVSGGNGGDGKRVDVLSNKTIQGTAPNSTLIGGLNLGTAGTTNVIIRNLNITHPGSTIDPDTGKYADGGDGISVWGATRVFITHCQFYDCGDGCCDITQGADFVTVSWCKFRYTPGSQVHRFAMILGNTDPTAGPDYHVTLHHNWWAEGCDQRMPSGSYSTAHLFNNLFTCSGNSYCTNGRAGAEFLVENSCYIGANNPCYKELGGRMRLSGNLFPNCSGYAPGYDSTAGSVTGDDNVFAPPYVYSPAAAADVPALVMGGAGPVVPPAIDWESWQRQSFTAAEIASGAAAEAADPDGDGLANLVEFALGSDPHAAAPLPLPVRDGGNLVLTFYRPQGRPGLVYGVEASSDLAHWSPADLEVVESGPTETVRASIPLPGDATSLRFLRLRIERR